jgi:glutaredoxin
MGPTASKANVIIYSRPGCHLCDQAKQAMEAAQCFDEYTLVEINIESDAALLRRYQYDIPVITIDGVEAFRHRLSAEAFRQKVLETDKQKSGGRPTFPTQS